MTRSHISFLIFPTCRPRHFHNARRTFFLFLNSDLCCEQDLEQHAQMVDLVSKHITECEQLEKKRYQSRGGGKGGLTGGAGRGGAQMTEIKRR